MAPLVSNLGGSVTGALGIVLAIWGYKAINHRLKRQQPHDKRRLGRFFCELSPAAVCGLVDKDPIPHLIIDVRSENSGDLTPLPFPASVCIRLAPNAVGSTLSSTNDFWLTRFKVPAPRLDTLIVCVGDTEEQMVTGCSLARAAGFERLATVPSGASALLSYYTFEQLASSQPEVPFISRHGLAALLRLRAKGLIAPERNLLLDVRRADERSLYGSIRGARHLPCDLVASALALPADAFEDRFHFRQPRRDDLLVMQCRTNRRAQWAAQLAKDAGYTRVLVYREGVYGWKFDGSVLPYPSYEQGDAPPDPEKFQVEDPDLGRGLEELGKLRVLEQAAGISPDELQED